MKYILLAEEITDWLKRSHFSWSGKPEKINSKLFQENLDDRTSIIFFKNYWQRGNEFFGRVSDLNESNEIWFWEVK